MNNRIHVVISCFKPMTRLGRAATTRLIRGMTTHYEKHDKGGYNNGEHGDQDPMNYKL